ncbi:hypothetical protein ACDA63_20165, partial [Uliginosibacterium sp. sgz301328]
TQEVVPGFGTDATPETLRRNRRPPRSEGRSESSSRAPARNVAPDGFDFDRPYAASADDKAPAAGVLTAASTATPARSARRAAPLAVLLGGSGR